jgi:hypothetical protein
VAVPDTVAQPDPIVVAGPAPTFRPMSDAVSTTGASLPPGTRSATDGSSASVTPAPAEPLVPAVPPVVAAAMHAVPGREDPDGPDASGVAARGAALVDAR